MANFIKVAVQDILIDSEAAGATVANKATLADTSALTVGDYLHNETDGTYATITAIDSATVVSLSADIVAVGEAVSIYSATESTDRLISAERYLLSEQAQPITNGIGTTTVNYASGGTDVLTITHVPQAANAVGVAVAVEEALLETHKGKHMPGCPKVSLPSGVAVLDLSIA